MELRHAVASSLSVTLKSQPAVRSSHNAAEAGRSCSNELNVRIATSDDAKAFGFQRGDVCRLRSVA